MNESGTSNLANQLHAALTHSLTGLDQPEFDLGSLPDLATLDDESLMELRYQVLHNATDYSTPEFINMVQSIDQELAARRNRDENSALKSHFTPEEEDQQYLSNLFDLLSVFGNISHHDAQILDHCPLIVHGVGVWKESDGYPVHLKVSINKLRDSLNICLRYMAEITDATGEAKMLANAELATLQHYLEEALQDIDFNSRDVAIIAMYEQRLERHYFGS